MPPPEFPLNPGTVEDLHKQCQNVFPMFFEGAKLLVNKALSNNFQVLCLDRLFSFLFPVTVSSFQVSHTMTLSNTQSSGYRFGATYLGQKVLSPVEAYPLVLGDIDPNGNLNASIVHAITNRLRCKVITQIQDSKWQSAQMTTDYKGDLYTVVHVPVNSQVWIETH